jgi:hypothetical protein
MATTATSPSKFPRQIFNSKRLVQMGGLGLGLGVAQHYLGNANDFFDHKFVTTKNPTDLADFYGTEDFMEVFCVFPFMVKFMMRGAEFDENGTIHAWGLFGPGELEVSIDFDEREEDIDGDGVPDTIAWFNKREHFRDMAPLFLGGFTLWEMSQNFGYQRLDDGTCEIYHHGENFKGLFPIRLLFQMHARYVAWATERYINSEAFGSENLEEKAEELRQNIPLHVFTEFLEGLTHEVEKAKSDSKGDPKKQGELEVTLQRLKTISTMEHHTTMPRLRTLRSHKTNVAQVQLVLDDEETKDTIRTAMKQIGSTKKEGPVSEIHKLARRTTMSAEKRDSKD